MRPKHVRTWSYKLTPEMGMWEAWVEKVLYIAAKKNDKSNHGAMHPTL